MSRSIEEVVALYRERKAERGPLLSKAQELTEAYNGDLAVPLPEIDKKEKVAVANLLQLGLDQNAMRVASTMADVVFPPERAGIKASESKADLRRKATLGWWDASKLDILMGRRSRHLLGYGSAPVRIRWDQRQGMPAWTIYNPLSTFAAPTVNPDDCCPDDAIFVYPRTLGWLERNYPAAATVLSKGPDPRPDMNFEVLEYVDGDEVVMGVLGKSSPEPSSAAYGGRVPYAGEMQVEIERVPNRIGMCPAIVPGRITLDRRLGRYDGLIGLFWQQAKLMALEVIAVQEGVWPKTWLVGRPNEVAEVLVEADPKNGITGQVKGGEITMTQLQPGYKTTDTIDRLEMAQRTEGGIPAEFSGQSATNVRTGRRGDSILSATIDFPIQEAQRIFERSLQAENRVAMATAKAFGGSAKRSFYVNWKGAKGRVDYVATRDFTDFTNFVAYPHAGADINQLVVGIGQRLATHLISRKSGRQLDPLIDDPEFEERQTTAEALSDALMGAVQQDVAKGTYTAVEVAQMMAELEADPEMSLAEVVSAVQQKMQAQQAQQIPPGAPEAQPGLAPGPAGPGGAANPGQQMPPGAIGPSQNVSGLAQLLSALHGPAQMAQQGAAA